MTGLDLGSTSPVEAKSGLVDAAKVSDGKNVREILGAGADANLVGGGEQQGNIAGATLVGASSAIHLDSVEMLIENGVAEDLKTVGAQMAPDALVDAAEKGDAKMVRELLAAGADVNHTKKGDDGRTALFKAAWKGHLEAAQTLIDAGADVEKGQTSTGWTPLFTAALEGHLEVVKALVGAKANVNKANNLGYTPLGWAIDKNHPTVVEYLKSVGAHE